MKPWFPWCMCMYVRDVWGKDCFLANGEMSAHRMPCLYTANLHHSGAHFQAEIEKRTCWTVTGKANTSFLAYLGVLHLSLFWRNKSNSQPWRDTNDTRGGAGLVPSRWWYWEESTWIVDYYPIEHHPTIRYMVFFMATIRWCPIYPKWDIYQSLKLLWPFCFFNLFGD